MENKCKNSSDGKHKWRHPRYEASIDNDKKLLEPWCECCHVFMNDSLQNDERLPNINEAFPSIH